jgi:hypothetical protein
MPPTLGATKAHHICRTARLRRPAYHLRHTARGRRYRLSARISSRIRPAFADADGAVCDQTGDDLRRLVRRRSGRDRRDVLRQADGDDV